MAAESTTGTGIESLLQDLGKIGIVLESGEDVFLLIQGYEKKLQELRKDINTYTESARKKEEELLNWMTKHIEDRQTISKLEGQLREKTSTSDDDVYATIKSSTTERTQQLNDIIKMLENEKGKLSAENDSLKKKLGDLEQKISTQSKEGEVNRKLIKLKEENEKLLKQTSLLNAELQEVKDGTNKLQHLLSSSGSAGQEQLTLFEDLQVEKTKLKRLEEEFARLQSDNDRLTVCNHEFKDEILCLKKEMGEADVIRKQKDVEHSFTLEQVSTLKKEKFNLMEEMERKVTEVHDLKEKEMRWPNLSEKVEKLEAEKKHLLTQLEKDKTDFQIELDVVRSQRERNKTELSTIKKELDKKNRVITEKEFEIRDLKERRISRDTPENESMYSRRQNAFHVTLQKVNVNGVKQFGVCLASKPSRVLITDAIEAQQKSVQPGDYVITINGVNVQNATNEFLFSLINEDFMNLVLLRPSVSEQEYEIKKQEKGLKVKQSFTVATLTPAASNSGIRIGDEVIKINDHDVQTLNLSKIERKLSHSSVKLYIRRAEEVVQSISNAASSSGGSQHAYETIQDTNPSPKLRNRITRSRVSVASSHSSTSRSTGPSTSPSDLQRRESVETTDFRRTPTFQSQAGQFNHSVSMKDMATDQDIVVTNEGSFIRNDDTEGSGDAEVMREPATRKYARDERHHLPEDDAYVNMSGGNGERSLHPRQHGAPLSNIPEVSMSMQNGESSHSSSEVEQDRQSSHSQQSPLPHRPPQALPHDAEYPNDDQYHYVERGRRFSMHGFLTEITLKKSANENSFGFKMFGGNCIGIFVDQIYDSLPAAREGLSVGARIISINGQDLTDAAFCFAAETLRNYANAPNVKITVVNTPAEQIAKYRLQRPYDSFTVRARDDSPKMSGCTLPFKENDTLKVTDTYKNYDPETGLYFWHAMKTVEGGIYGAIREGAIPAELSSAVPVSDDYPETFDVYGATKVKGKSRIFKGLKRKPSTEKFEDPIMFRHGFLYEYMDDSVRI